MACNLTLVLANLYIVSASLLPSDATNVGYNECEDIITLVMASLRSRCGHYILPCGFFLSSFFFFPRLISAVGDWMSTILPHMVWPYCEFRMHA